MINKFNYNNSHCDCEEHKHCLTEVTRWEMINSGKTKSPDRFLKSKNYSPKDFKNVDFEDLFVNDTFTWSTRVYGEEHYIVTISFEGPFDYLKDTLKGMRGKNRYKRITVNLLAKALSVCLDTEDLFVDCSCPDFCLTEDTEIKLLNGEALPIKDILTKFNNNEELWVYSTDENGDFKPGKVTDVWVSGQTKELIKVTLDNGKEITTTPTHRYMLRDGSYLPANELSVGQSLMSLYFTNCYDNELVKLNSMPNMFTDVLGTIIDIDTNELNYKVKSIEHIVLEEPVNVYDLTVDKYNNFYVNAGVILHNCYRFAYWATQADCKYGTPQNRAPTVRNVKNNKGYVCKHILAILYGKRWVQSAARAWYEYVQANPELSEYYIWGEPKKRNNNNNKNNSNNSNNSDDYDDDYYDEDEVELPWAH